MPFLPEDSSFYQVERQKTTAEDSTQHNTLKSGEDKGQEKDNPLKGTAEESFPKLGEDKMHPGSL